MKEANARIMKLILEEVGIDYKKIGYDRAMQEFKEIDSPNNSFVRMNSGMYSVMDKYYKLVK